MKILTEELEIIDQTMAELDDRRVVIVRRIVDATERHDLLTNVLQFPGRISVRRSPCDAGADWPGGSKVAPTDKA
jgi:hypothetical protein